MKNTLILLVLLLFAGCGSSNNRPKTETETQGTTPAESVREAVAIPSDSGVVRMELRDGYGKMTIRKQPRQTIYLEFESNGYTKLYAAIAPLPDSMGNVRISGIILPNGAMDGPFGRDMTYDIPSTGTIQLVIGESLMQGDPWGGEFNAEVRLSK